MNFDHIKALPRSVWAFEGQDVRSFMLIGTKYGLLVDTGDGKINVRELASQITHQPLAVACTHPHADVTGCNKDFTFLYINSWDRPKFEDIQFPIDYTWYLEPPQPTQAESDQRTPFKEVSAGDLCEMGGRSLRVIETPGHTKRSISFLEEAGGILFVGDTLCSRSVELLDEDSDLGEYIGTLEMLQVICKGTRKRPPVKTIYCDHGELEVPVSMIDDMLKLALDIEAGKAKVSSTYIDSVTDKKVKVYRNGQASIAMPA